MVYSGFLAKTSTYVPEIKNDPCQMMVFRSETERQSNVMDDSTNHRIASTTGRVQPHDVQQQQRPVSRLFIVELDGLLSTLAHNNMSLLEGRGRQGGAGVLWWTHGEWC